MSKRSDIIKEHAQEYISHFYQADLTKPVKRNNVSFGSEDGTVGVITRTVSILHNADKRPTISPDIGLSLATNAQQLRDYYMVLQFAENYKTDDIRIIKQYILDLKRWNPTPNLYNTVGLIKTTPQEKKGNFLLWDDWATYIVDSWTLGDPNNITN